MIRKFAADKMKTDSPGNSESKSIILFDGVCNLCSGFVQFVIRHDDQSGFKFCSLQSNAGGEILKKYNFPSHKLSSVVLIKNDQIFLKSDAVLQIARELKGWKWFYFLRFIPRSIRNAVYDLAARYRYKIFGKRKICMIPEEGLKAKFLE
ncbi:MAG: DUF393 domain-containing protein [Chitinophagales bacterium]